MNIDKQIEDLIEHWLKKYLFDPEAFDMDLRASIVKDEIKELIEKSKEEALKEVDKKIWEAIDKRMKHIDDGIYAWKVNPEEPYFADNFKNELKNITFKLTELRKQP